MNPSQEPAPPEQQPGPPPTDPTAGYQPETAAVPGYVPPSGAGGGYGPGHGSGGYQAGPDYGSDGYPAAPGYQAEGYGGARGDGASFGLAHPTGPEFVDGGVPPWEPRRSVRRPWRRTLLVSVLTALVIFVLGGPLGLLWAWIAPGVPVIDTGSGIVVNDPSPEEYVAADGWFTLLGVGFGLLGAIVAWLVVRRDRGPFLLLGVVAGMLGAGYLVAPWLGEMIGRDDYQQWRETAIQGATYLAPPEVHSLGPTLVPAFLAAVVLTLLAGWSNDPDLERPGAKPGYGPNQYGPNQADGWEPGHPGPDVSTSPGIWGPPDGPEVPQAPGGPAQPR
ncbi:MAG TPA: hypothetical protein VGB74_19840 [Actinoplanes sp.]